MAGVLVHSRWLRVLASRSCFAGWSALVALGAEFGRAQAAAHRYEILRQTACASAKLNAARRVFAEYYAQPGEHSDRARPCRAT